MTVVSIKSNIFLFQGLRIETAKSTLEQDLNYVKVVHPTLYEQLVATQTTADLYKKLRYDCLLDGKLESGYFLFWDGVALYIGCYAEEIGLIGLHVITPEHRIPDPDVAETFQHLYTEHGLDTSTFGIYLFTPES